MSGNPVTQQVETVVVTDPSGNPVTGMFFSNSFLHNIFFKIINWVKVWLKCKGYLLGSDMFKNIVL